MGKNVKIAIAAGLLAAIAIYTIRRITTHRKLSKVADDGYETASDVLYKGKGGRRKQHYGPVLPR